MRTVLLSAILATSLPALAQDASRDSTGFHNDMVLSDFYWSPAQLYQVDRPVSQVAYLKGIGTAKISSDPTTQKDSFDINTFGGGFYTPLSQTKVTVGFGYNQMDITSKLKTTQGAVTANNGIDEDVTTVTPSMAYAITPHIEAGFRYAITESQTKTDGATSIFNYNVFSPAITFHNDDFEAGVIYQPTVNLHDADGAETDAGSLIVHSQARVSPSTTAGLHIEYDRNKELDDSSYKNSYILGAAVESWVSSVVQAGLGGNYTAESAKNEANRGPFNISSVGFSVYGNYVASAAATVGAGLQYSRTGNRGGKTTSGQTQINTTSSLTLTGLTVTAAYKM